MLRAIGIVARNTYGLLNAINRHRVIDEVNLDGMLIRIHQDLPARDAVQIIHVDGDERAALGFHEQCIGVITVDFQSA